MARRLATALGIAVTAAAVAACGDQQPAAQGTIRVKVVTATTAIQSATHTAQHASSTTPRGRPAIAFAQVPLTGSGHTIRIPRGWRASVWAHVDDARLETWTPQGSLLVSSPDDGVVTELTPHAGAAPTSRTIISGLTNPQGLAFDRLGGHEYLYVASSNELDRYTWAGGDATAHTVLVPDLPDTLPAGDDVHRLKNVVVGHDHTVYVDIGSSSNASVPPPVPSGGYPRAAVLSFHPDGRLERVYSTGIRNGDGLSIAPDGSLWTAVNERDQIAYPFHKGFDSGSDRYGQVVPDYVDNHPPDEVARLTPGRNLGWPYCDPDPDTAPGSPGSDFDYADMGFTADQQTNAGGGALDCSSLPHVEQGLPAHSAPIGLSFLTGSTLPARWAAGAVVAGHGSWDRQPPRPPVVYWLPWRSATKTLGRAIVLVSGFQEADGSRWGRLADAVAGPDGALYVTDDQSGAVYRITP